MVEMPRESCMGSGVSLVLAGSWQPGSGMGFGTGSGCTRDVAGGVGLLLVLAGSWQPGSGIGFGMGSSSGTGWGGMWR